MKLYPAEHFLFNSYSDPVIIVTRNVLQVRNFSVYDYWVDKRLRLRKPLIPMVKTDKREAVTPAPSFSGTHDPYMAFRRRTEKMQTRKNRKNDEVSYEKMLKLRRDLSRDENRISFF